MGIATNSQWNRSLTGAEIDGVDMWAAISELGESPHTEIVHFVNESMYSIQFNMLKLNSDNELPEVSVPHFYFTEDQDPDASSLKCSVPSLVFGSVISDIVHFLIPNSIAVAVAIFTAVTLLVAGSLICWVAWTMREKRLDGLRTDKDGNIWSVDHGSHAASGLLAKDRHQQRAASGHLLPFPEYGNFGSSSWSSEDDEATQSSVPGFEESDLDERDFLPELYQKYS